MTNSPALQNPYSDLQDTVRDIRFYSIGVIIPLGIVANIISAGVFLRSRMRKTTPGQYFLALALADNMILLGELVLWLNRWDSEGYRLGFSFMETNEFICKSVNYVRYCGRLWSSWLVVAISAERFITVAFPLKVYKYSNPTKARIVIIIQFIISAGLSVTAFFALGLRPYEGQSRCLILSDYAEFYSAWSMACLIAGEMFIPCILVALFTALIIWKLTRAQEARLGSQEGQREMSRRRAKERQATISLLAIAITFVTLRLPYIISYQLYMNQMNDISDHWKNFQVYTAYSITFIFAVMNYAINFLLYCICGSTFRSELRQCVRCKRTASSQTSVYSQYRSIRIRSSPILQDRHRDSRLDSVVITNDRSDTWNGQL